MLYIRNCACRFLLVLVMLNCAQAGAESDLQKGIAAVEQED
jgi:hypothetical protein